MLAKINWNPSNTDLRKFGLTCLVGFGIIGGIAFWRGFHTAAEWIWGIGGSVGLLAIIAPPLSRPLYAIWMGVAFVMGTIVSTLILLFIFYLIFTPVGIFMKIIGRDALKMKKKSFPDDTYWHEHPNIDDKDYYARLF